MEKTKHHNQESVVVCPIDGCDHEGLSRGIHLHIRQSSGDGHGPNGDVPEHLDLSDLEVVGQQSVEMDYPDTREVEDKARLCPFCGRAFNGFQGVKIHLGQKKGQGVHPADADETQKEDCPIAHVDDDMNVIELVDEGSIMPSTKRRVLDGQDSVPLERVEKFALSLEEQGEDELAQRVREELL